ncbi:hypothetical protein NQ317_017081, partial [Molorchus minor]
PYPTIIGLCLGGILFGILMVAVTWYCYRRRMQNHKRNGPDQPLAFQTHRRPTAVKSPAGTGAGMQYLKRVLVQLVLLKHHPGRETEGMLHLFPRCESITESGRLLIRNPTQIRDPCSGQ